MKHKTFIISIQNSPEISCKYFTEFARLLLKYIPQCTSLQNDQTIGQIFDSYSLIIDHGI